MNATHLEVDWAQRLVGADWRWLYQIGDGHETAAEAQAYAKMIEAAPALLAALKALAREHAHAVGVAVAVRASYYCAAMGAIAAAE